MNGNNKNNKNSLGLAIGMCLGMSVGIAVGASTHNIGCGCPQEWVSVCVLVLRLLAIIQAMIIIRIILIQKNNL